MASFEVHGLDELVHSMSELAQIPEAVQNQMLVAQAEVVAEAQRTSAIRHGVYRTGQTMDSIKAGKPQLRKGVRTLYVAPDGLRKKRGGETKRRRNAEVAFVNQYGVPKRGQAARPFISKANETSAEATTQAGAEVFYKWQESLDL